MAFQTTVAEIFNEFYGQSILQECKGTPSVEVTGIASVEKCGPGDLVFVDKKEYLPQLKERRPAAVVTSPALAGVVTEHTNATTMVAKNVALAHAKIKNRYAARDFTLSGWSGVHPTAVVHETARIAPTAIIEPRVVIGKNTTIDEGCRIMAGAVIEHDVAIGARSVIHPLVVIGYGCRLGLDVVVGSGSIIGSDGFGFAQDERHKSYPIPQTGIVVIEDRVRVGANNTIDRAAFSETRIGAGTKLDNLCHVAHNVTIGQDCLLTAFLCVAGSTKIGDRVIASGQTGVLDHVEVCSDVVLVQRAGVGKDIDKPGVYAGAPLQPLGEYMKNSAVLRSANDLRKRVANVEKALAIKVDKEPESPRN